MAKNFQINFKGGGIKNVELILKSVIKANKTGLQPVSKPVEQILGFYGPIYKRGAKMDPNRRTDFEISVIRPVFN